MAASAHIGNAGWFGAEEESQTQAVAAVFRAYKAALIAGDGVAAAQLVDSATFDYFGALKDLAVSGAPETVKARPFVDRLLIISMRQIMAPEELADLELGELMNKAVEQGWISTQTVAQLDIGEVLVDGESATAKAVSLNPAVSFEGSGSTEEANEADEANDEVRYQFLREDGAWKFGFASLVASLNRLVEDFTAQLGTDQDELIFVLVQSLTGKPVLPEVWEVP